MEIYYDKVILSLEKAYHIFLRDEFIESDDDIKMTLHEYLVYSQFMRCGYFVKRHKQETDKDCSSDDNEERTTNNKSTENQTQPLKISQLCTFNYLYELLNHRKCIISTHAIQKQSYEEIKESMDNIISNFHGDTFEFKPPIATSSTKSVNDNYTESSVEENLPKKRKASNDFDAPNQTKKIAKIDVIENDQYYGTKETNSFMVGSEFKQFQNVFNKIDVIRLKTVDDSDDVDDKYIEKHPSNLKFSFDFWTFDGINKTKTESPQFRIVVIRYALRSQLCLLMKLKHLHFLNISEAHQVLYRKILKFCDCTLINTTKPAF